MKLLETCVVHYDGKPKYLKLYVGDLTAIPRGEEIDLLVLSAFPDDYAPTRSSLIGALHRKGVSVDRLARDKQVDLRHAFSCWLSKDLTSQSPDIGFRRVLCFEPRTHGSAPERVGDLFRAIMPFALGEQPITSVAMPLLAAGDQGLDEEVMLRSLFDASVQWLKHGLPVDTLKIVVYSEPSADRLRRVFSELTSKVPSADRGSQHGTGLSPRYDCFVSYSHDDDREVEVLISGLKATKPGIRLFQDKVELKVGDAWQSKLDEALASCRKVIAVFSPSYLDSPVCVEEFNMARLRHRETAGGVLLAVYLRSASLPRYMGSLLYLKSLQFADCREGDDMDRVRNSGSVLASQAFA